MRAGIRALTSVVLTTAALTGCSDPAGGAATSPPTSTSATAGTSTASTSSTSSAPSTSEPATATTSPGPTASGPGPAVPSSPAALAQALRAACTGQYTVRSTVTGQEPMTIAGRGDLAARSLAVHLDGDADTEVDLELIGRTVYTSLAGVTSGKQRIRASLDDPDDANVVEPVLPIIAATDLARVVAAVGAGQSVRRTDQGVVVMVPGRSVVSLLGATFDGTVPASAPLTLVLDAQGRPTTVTTRLGGTVRSSTYGGWQQGAPIVAPVAGLLVENPL